MYVNLVFTIADQRRLQMLFVLYLYVSLCPSPCCGLNFCESLSGYTFICAFYRAMHFSAKRGIAIACRLSVCLSVRLFVCDVGGL